MTDAIVAWTAVNTTQLFLWDAQTRADALVSAADDTLDDLVDRFAGALGAVVSSKRDPRFTMYFKIAPSELKRPVLGGQL